MRDSLFGSPMIFRSIGFGKSVRNLSKLSVDPAIVSIIPVVGATTGSSSGFDPFILLKD